MQDVHSPYYGPQRPCFPTPVLSRYAVAAQRSGARSCPLSADPSLPGEAAARLVVGHFIHGQNSLAPGARCTPVFNPALGRAVREVGMATAADVDAAVRSARSARPAWARTPAPQRSRAPFRVKELLGEHRAP